MSFYFLNESMRREQNLAHSLRESFSTPDNDQRSTVPSIEYPVKIKKEFWQRLDNPSRISREFTFDDIGQQRFFVSSLMKDLDIHNHDIEIILKSNTVTLTTRTDVYDEVTELDLEIARAADEMYEDSLFIVVTDEPSF